MKNRKKLYTATIAAVLATALAVPAYAAPKSSNKNKISSIKLEITDELKIDGGLDDDDVLDIEADGDNYVVTEWEIMNAGFAWSEEDIPEVMVTIETEDDYSFSVTKDKVKIKGAAATVISVKRESAQELFVTLQLKPMSERVGTVESATLEGTRGSWTAAYGAVGYHVYLYKNNTVVGSRKVTADTTYDFSASMNKEGDYYFKVRAIGPSGSKDGEFTTSQSVYRTKEDIIAGNNAPAQQNTQGIWQQDELGWKFIQENGAQTLNNWLFINDKWYFFKEDGYMQTGWLNWNGSRYYLGPDGDMWVSRQTPDGIMLSESGAAVQ